MVNDIAVQPAFLRVQLLPIQMLLVVLTNVLLIFFPLPWNTAVLASTYTALMLYESRVGERNLYSLAVLGASLIATVFTGLRLWDVDLPQVLLVFNVMLLLASAFELVWGSVMADEADARQGSPVLLRQTAWLWGGIHASGTMLIAFILIAEPPVRSLIYLLPLLPLTGVVLTLWMHLGGRLRPMADDGFDIGDYRFSRIAPTADALRPFYQVFVREAMPSIRQGAGAEADSIDALVSLKMSLDRDNWPHTLFFAAYRNNEIVGTISCMLKRPGNALGFEVAHSRPLCVRALCRYGNVLEVGRLSVDRDHRYGRAVLQGLLRCVIEQAFRADAAFLVVQSFLSVQPVYRKIGFFPVDERPSHQVGVGVAITPMAFNLAARVVCGAARADAADTISEALAPYCAERYFKRQAVRALFGRACAWKLSSSEIVALLRPADRLAHADPEQVRAL